MSSSTRSNSEALHRTTLLEAIWDLELLRCVHRLKPACAAGAPASIMVLLLFLVVRTERSAQVDYGNFIINYIYLWRLRAAVMPQVQSALTGGLALVQPCQAVLPPTREGRAPASCGARYTLQIAQCEMCYTQSKLMACLPPLRLQLLLSWQQSWQLLCDSRVQHFMEVIHGSLWAWCVAPHTVGRLLQAQLHCFTQCDVLHLHT